MVVAEQPQAPNVGRLAPSPTGHLHLGHARSFLLAWWHARSRGGKLILRLEDVDVARATQAHVDGAQRDLEWLGLDWDGPARLQSEGLDRLRDAAFELQQRGFAYPCSCSRGEIRQAIAKAQATPSAHAPLGQPLTGGELRYPGTCRERYASLEEAQSSSGHNAGLRFRPRHGDVPFVDGIHGSQCRNVEGEVGDFMILRRDKTPAYQLAVVVDDACDGVTEVVRGDDLLSSTTRQLLLYEALDLQPPRYWHVPLVCDHTGRRLAKREADLGLSELREAGVDPRTIVTWAAATSGQLEGTTALEGAAFEGTAGFKTEPFESAGQRVEARDIVPNFDIARLPTSPVRLDQFMIDRFLAGSH